MKTVLGQRLRAARQALHPPVTQRDVARRMNLSPSAVTLWETGKTEPSAGDLAELSQWFNVSVDWLLGVGNKPTKAVKPPIYVVPVVAPMDLIRWHWDAVADFLQTSVAYPPQTAAAILVASDALASECPTGAYAVVSKAHPVGPNAVVLAHLGRASEPVIRRLVHDGRDDLLVADDTRYPSYRLDSGAKILGRVTEVNVRRLLV